MSQSAPVLAGFAALVLAGCSGQPAPPPPDPAGEEEARAIERAAAMLEESLTEADETEQTREEAAR